MNARQLKLIDNEILESSAECLKVIAHPARLRIIDILMQTQLPVGDIAELVDLPPHQTSEHLRLMKGHGLLDSVREGRTVYYKITSPNLPGVINCIRKNCEKIQKEKSNE